MKISKVSIKNYRSCVSTSFEPDDHLSVLIGPNGSGKTNVLSALRLLPALISRNAMRYASRIPSPSLCELRVDFAMSKGKVTYVARINIVTSEKNQDEIVHAEEEWLVPSKTGRRKKLGIPSAFLREITNQDFARSGWTTTLRHERNHLINWLKLRGVTPEAFDMLSEVIQFFPKINYYSASQFTNPGSAPVSFEVEREASNRVGISLTGHKRLLFDIYQAYREGSATYKEFISLVGSEGVGLIDSIEFDEIQTSSSSFSVMTGGKVLRREKTNLLVVPRVKIGSNTLSPSQLSEGSFKTLALIFYLVTDNSALLMIEEPEVCVHHGLLSSIVELIKAYSVGKQILVSTHSDSVLDKVDIENVFGVQKVQGHGTQVSHLKKSMTSKEVNALKRYLEEEGSLGEYWRHGDLEQA